MKYERHIFSNEELRNIIIGKTKFKKCLSCNLIGKVQVGGVGALDGIVLSGEQLKQLSDDDYYWDDCDECGGLGYIVDEFN